jgi:F-type H+-transporting ATPase subunit epsilon
MKQKSTAARLNVIAREPFHKYYEGPAKAVSAANQVGEFDILPGHADFFSVMTAGEVSIDTDDGPVSFAVSSGIITVRDDQVMLFVNM